MKTKSKTISMIAVFLSFALLYASAAVAGDLEPSGPPASTMKTLDQVEPRIPIPASDTPTSTFVISESGSYYLTGNRKCSDIGIRVDVNDVTIDLCGYTLSGPDETGTDGINFYGLRKNIEVRNGTIRDFRYAVVALNALGGSYRVKNIRATSNRAGGINLNADNCSVTGCTIDDNGDSVPYSYGIFVRANSVVTGNTISNNGASATLGVYGIQTFLSCVVTGNTVCNNGDSATCNVYGIDAGEGSTLIGNTAYNNGSSASGDYIIGIHADSGSTLSNNAAKDNGDSSTGIEVYGIYAGGGTMLNGNTSYGNGTSATGKVYGIYAHRGSILKNNTAYQNSYQMGDPKTAGDVYGICTNRGCTVIGNTARHNGYKCNDINIYGLYVDIDSTVVANNASYNGISDVNCTIVGLNVLNNCLVDQNTASGNGGTNMVTDASCTLGTNHATP